MEIRTLDIMIIFAVIASIVLSVKDCGKPESTPIVVVKDAEGNTSDVEIFNEDLVSYINKNIFLCPECGSVLYLFSSHGIGAASAQFYCYNCGYESAEVYKESYDPDDILEDECKHECIENFKKRYGNSFNTLAIQISNTKVNNSEKESD